MEGATLGCSLLAVDSVVSLFPSILALKSWLHSDKHLVASLILKGEFSRPESSERENTILLLANSVIFQALNPLVMWLLHHEALPENLPVLVPVTET